MRNRILRYTSLTIAVVAMLTATTVAYAQLRPEPPVLVIDGNVLNLERSFFRLWGIDAPELDQICTIDNEEWECGKTVVEALRTFFIGKFVYCEGSNPDANEFDRRGFVLSDCYA